MRSNLHLSSFKGCSLSVRVTLTQCPYLLHSSFEGLGTSLFFRLHCCSLCSLCLPVSFSKFGAKRSKGHNPPANHTQEVNRSTIAVESTQKNWHSISFAHLRRLYPGKGRFEAIPITFDCNFAPAWPRRPLYSVTIVLETDSGQPQSQNSIARTFTNRCEQ